jgi:cobalt-zinc-cadmium resistance protein CzcA
MTLVFEDHVDVFRARQMVSERLLEVSSELPRNIQPKLGPVTSGLGEIFFYSIEFSETKNGADRFEELMELRSIQDWFVKPRLLTVKGVAEVNTIGGFEKQFHIQPDPQKMARYGLHFSDLIEAMEKNKHQRRRRIYSANGRAILGASDGTAQID